jgi:hypothetical protein
MSASARINGNEYGWSSVEFTAPGAGILDGVTALDYNDKLEPGLTRGTSAVPRGVTRGQWSGAGSVEMLRLDYDRWILALGPGFSEIDLVCNASYFEAALGVKTDTIFCRLTESAVTLSDSSDGAKVKCTLFVIAPILWNGIPRVIPV